MKRFGIVLLFVVLTVAVVLMIVYDSKRKPDNEEPQLGIDSTNIVVVYQGGKMSGIPYEIIIVIDCFDSTGKFLGGYKTEDEVYWAGMIDGKKIAEEYWDSIRW